MIFYFSSTGNSKWAARQIADRTGEELIPIPQALKTHCRYTLQADETLGFVFPVHGWRVPRIVEEFLQKVEFNAATQQPSYCYCLVTAGDSIGKTMERFEKSLSDVHSGFSIQLNLVESVIMPESYVGLPGMVTDTEEKEKQKIQAAEQKIADFIGQLEKRAGTVDGHPAGWDSLVRGTLPSLCSGLIGGFFTRFLITDKPFRVDSSRCVKCGICAQVCPVGDIKGGLGLQPQWIHNGKCLTCFACYHHCPHHAIDFGRRTRKKGQYFFGRRKLHKD